jgi:hypothetical protein
VRRAHGACGIVGDDAVGPADGCSERAAEVFRRMFQRVDSLCHKSTRATSDAGARPRPVSIACRYVRTHAMGAVGAVEQEQQQQYSQACLDFAGDTTSLKPAKTLRQLPRPYNFISRLLRPFHCQFVFYSYCIHLSLLLLWVYLLHDHLGLLMRYQFYSGGNVQLQNCKYASFFKPCLSYCFTVA